jgi:hypothetical protein
MESVQRNVRDLSQDDRSALERVVGHALAESQQVIIQITGDLQALTQNGAISVAGQLPTWCNVYEGLTYEQIDELDRSIVRLPGGRDV